jgi:hypothetical protein
MHSVVGCLQAQQDVSKGEYVVCQCLEINTPFNDAGEPDLDVFFYIDKNLEQERDDGS